MAETSNLVQEFFRDLDNPQLYEKVEGIPVFVPHERKKKLPDGTIKKNNVDEARLKRIATRLEQMQREGNLPVITAGHRKVDPKVAEEDQPKPWGVAKDAKFGYYRTPDGKKLPCLLTTFCYRRDQKDKEGVAVNEAARTYPFRSVDFYGDTDEITGIALLRRDPELEMGLLSYTKNNRPFFQYAEENMEPESNPTEAPNAMVGSEDELTPEEAGQAMKYAKHYERHHPAFKYMCEQHAATQGSMGTGCGEAGGAAPAAGGGQKYPSGGNTSIPKTEAKEMKKDPDQMNRNGAVPSQYTRVSDADLVGVPEQFARAFRSMEDGIISTSKANADLQNRLATAEQRAAASDRAHRLTQYSAELTRLADEYDMILEDEMKDCENLTPQQFQRHVERIQKHYKPLPVQDRLPWQGSAFQGNGREGTVGGTNFGQLTEDQMEQVNQYIREHPDNDYTRAEEKALTALGFKK